MFRNFKRNSYLIAALLIFTIIFCKIIGSYRYSEFHEIYKVGIYFCYFLHILNCSLSIINLFKMHEVGFLKTKNFIFILLSLSPIFFCLLLPTYSLKLNQNITF